MNTLSQKATILLIFVLLAGCIIPQPSVAPDEVILVPAEKEPTTQAPIDAPTEADAPTQAEAPQPAQSGGWWNETVFYEIFVRSFQDSDGDGVGDINGLIEKLDYLNDGDPATASDLGVTGLWLMPITESPSYHGYDVVDYYAVDQEYGSKEDFQRLMAEAHKRGIRIIIDLVLNHTGVDHPWFKESDAGNPEFRDWYIWTDPEPTYRGPWGQDVWYAGKDGYYYAVFWSGMPDLNVQNPEVNAEIEQITRFWLEEMGVDGFRMDAIKHLVENGSVQENTRDTHAWLQAYHTFYKNVDPEAFVVGEAWTNTSQVLDYIGDEVDVAFEFDLAEAFVLAANGPIASAAIEQMGSVIANYPPGSYGVFLTNHDQDRVMSKLKDFEKAKLAAVMMLTAPGVPFIYYGEEIGMTGTKPDENIRRPMQWNGEGPGVGFTTGTPWNAASGDYAETNVALQTSDPDSLLNLYRDLIHLRGEHAALRTGGTLQVEADTQRLYAVLRYDDQEAFLILVNVHTKPLTPELYSLTLASGPFSGPVQATSVLGQPDPAAPVINASGGFSQYVPFQEIPPHTAIIIRLTP